MRDADRAEPHIGVAQHHPLGPPGRAGSVEQGGEIVGVVADGAEAVAMTEQGGPLLFVERRAVRGRSPGSSVASRARPLSSKAAPLSARMWATWSALEQRVDRHVDQAGAGAGERQQAGQPGLGEPARDPVAGREAPRLERGRERADRRLEPGIIERALARQPAPARRPRRAGSDGRAGGASDPGVCNLHSCLNGVMIGRARRGIKRDG